jgi:hypothetical protein
MGKRGKLADINKKILKMCQCSKEFLSYKHANRKFCSLECSQKFQKKRTVPKVVLKCLYCRESFLVSNYRKNKAKFCSSACKCRYYDFGKIYGKMHHCYKNGRYIKGKICIDCGKPVSESSQGRCLICHGKAYRGKNSPHFGHSNRAKNIIYNDKSFHSSWEANFYKWCILSNIKCLYELKVFQFVFNKRDTTYTPDFYLPEFDLWIEIKGRWIRDAKERFESFKLQYKQTAIEVWNREKLQELGVIIR